MAAETLDPTGAYVTNFQYAAHGQPTRYVLGNNLWHEPSYNSRLQMTGFVDLKNADVSEFAKGLGDASHVEAMIESALGSAPSRAPAFADGATAINVNLGVTIGTDASGNATTTIRVVLNSSGEVHSAFPVHRSIKLNACNFNRRRL